MAEWITTTEAVRLSGYHPRHLRDILRAGKINARKFGLTWQVDKRSLEAYMREGERSGDKRRGGKFAQS